MILYICQLAFTIVIIIKNIFSVSVSWSLIKILWLNFELLFTFDQISYVFRLTVTYIRVCVLIFRHFYIGSDKHYLYFHRLILLFISSIILLIFRSNSLRIILGWDGLGVSSYLLVLYYNNSLSSTCAITTVLRNRLGDLFLIVLLGFMFSLGRFNILINKFRFEFIFLRVLILFAGCTKRAQIPFRAWLPLAIIAPTPVRALVHRSTLVTAGLYLIIRHFIRLPTWRGCNFLFIMGGLTIIIARLRALFEIDVKKIVALSTLSQLGVIRLGVGIELPIIAFLHLLIHAYFKAIIFIIVGQLIYFSLGYQSINFMGRLGVARPVIIGGFLIGGFSLIGIPFMAAFYSKEPIIEILFTRNFLLTGYFLILRGVCLTCLYSLRLLLLSGIFLVRHCSTIHLLERIKRIIRISLLFLPSFFRGVIFSNLFSFLRFEGLVNRNVKLVICAFIIFRFLPLSNINLMFKRSDSLNKNYLHPWFNTYIGLIVFSGRLFNINYMKLSKISFFVRRFFINYNMKNIGPNKFFLKEKIFLLERTNLSKNLSFLIVGIFIIGFISF